MDENRRTKRRKLQEKKIKKRKPLVKASNKRVRRTPEPTIQKEKQAEQKPKKYVSKKRIKRRNRFILISSLVLILAGTLTVLSLTVFFPIKTIKIVNNEKYTADEISASIGVVKGDNLLLASESRAYSALKDKYPYIEAIEFDKKLPFTLNVNVKEYDVFAQIKYGGIYLRIGEDGKILEQSGKFKKGSPVVTGVSVKDKNIGNIISFTSETGDENIFSKINEIITAFADSEIGGVTLINFSDMQDIRVTYNNRIVMLLGSSSNLDKKLAHAKATLEVRGDNGETGTLNLSRIPSAKNEASFIPRDLETDEIAGKK